MNSLETVGYDFPPLLLFQVSQFKIVKTGSGGSLVTHPEEMPLTHMASHVLRVQGFGCELPGQFPGSHPEASSEIGALPIQW